nr:histidine kinase [Bacteroidota bacterium]
QLSGTVFTEDGNRRSLKAIHSFENSIDQVQKHFNLFYDEGCIMGPGMSDVGDKLSRSARVVAYTQKRFRDVDREHWQKEIDEFSTIDLHRTFKNDDQRLPTPDNDRINEILRLIGKSETKHNRSCGQCGFDSCRHFATSVAQGLTRTEMCIDFSINNKNKYITTLRENRKEARQTLKELGGELDDTRKEYDLLKEKLETSRKIMNQIPSGVVITDEKLKVLSSNTSFIDLLGDEARDINEVVPGLRGADLKTLVPIQFYKVFQNVLATGENILSRDVMIDGSLLNLSVFSIRGHKVVGGIVRDMHTPEVRNEQIIQRVTEVIDQNLNMVQQIGFLLGEGASKTEAMLNSIIRLHEKKKKG